MPLVTARQISDLPEQLTDGADLLTPTPDQGPLRFARTAGSAIAGHDAAPWVTDFLNAAYHRRAPAERDVDDLRLASCILTTHWDGKRGQHRLRVTDLPAFNRAFQLSLRVAA